MLVISENKWNKINKKTPTEIVQAHFIKETGFSLSLIAQPCWINSWTCNEKYWAHYQFAQSIYYCQTL